MPKKLLGTTRKPPATSNSKEYVYVGLIADDDATVAEVRVRDGIVTAYRPLPENKANDVVEVIAPPLVDIQVNGGAGIDLQSPDLSPDDVLKLNDYLRSWGVGHWAPTLITNAPEIMERNCAVIAEARRKDLRAFEAIAGLHLEGPWISPEDGPRGAHPREHVRDPDLRLFNRLAKAAQDHILYTTIAPELPGAKRFIRALSQRNITVSLGHHNAGLKDIIDALDAGASMCTHIGNGMHTMIHRHNNVLWPQLAFPDLPVSMIADGHHLPPTLMRVIIELKAIDNLILTSDLTALAGMPPGAYSLFGNEVLLHLSGLITIKDSELLAGSGMPLLNTILIVAGMELLDIRDALTCATTVPDEVLDVGLPEWPPKPGSPAHLMVLNFESGPPPPDVPGIHALYIHGERVPAREDA